MNNKRVVIFNSYDYGSTGTLCCYLRNVKINSFEETIFISSNKPRSNGADYYVSNENNRFYRKLQVLIARTSNKYGFIGKKATKKALNYIDKRILPSEQLIFSIHQIESSILNLEEIIKYAKKKNIKIFITLHDCWLFTGKCAYYDMTGCEKWKTECDYCPFKEGFPPTKTPHLKKTYNHKIDLLLKNKDIITLICPSHWMAEQVRQSRLHELKCVVIHNGIEPFSKKEINHSPNEKIGLVAAAHPWAERKGLQFLIELSSKLDYTKFSLTVIGVDSKLQNAFSSNAKIFGRIDREELLNEFYNNDYFINPTLEDNFPTTNLEALATGLKIISFQTGGSCEAFDEETGYICEEKSSDSLLKIISGLEKNTDRKASVNRFKKFFTKEKFIENYYNLFNQEL